jgi:hypothetical protein
MMSMIRPTKENTPLCQQDFPDGLTTPIQFQVDILNSKDVITEDSIATVIATPVSLKPIMTPPIVVQPII